MTPKEYLEFTDTTAAYPKDCEVDYLIHGLCGELGELCEQPGSLLELGDCLWYVMRLLGPNHVPTTWPDGVKDHASFDWLVRHIASVAQARKKDLRDRTPMSIDLSRYASFARPGWVACLLFTLCAISDWAARLDSTIEDVAKINKQKLSDRLTRGTIKGSGDYR